MENIIEAEETGGDNFLREKKKNYKHRNKLAVSIILF